MQRKWVRLEYSADFSGRVMQRIWVKVEYSASFSGKVETECRGSG
jgi:hypothetical protein